jgi:hypothetical protein
VPDETRLTIMGSQQEQTERMEALRGLIERLSAPDLTLVEAKVLRESISELLEWDNQPGGWDGIGSRSLSGDLHASARRSRCWHVPGFAAARETVWDG